MKNSITIIISLLLLFNCNIVFCQNATVKYGDAEIIENTIIVKLTSNSLFKSYNGGLLPVSKTLNMYLQSIGIEKYIQLYPNAKIDTCYNCVDIRSIFKISYTQKIEVDEVIRNLNRFEEIEYAEPSLVHYPLLSVNDPKLSGQYNLGLIDIFRAWDISMSDSSIVIGIVDTEFDLNHEDLIDKVAYNYDDEIDGIDNDNDGFIDNFRGWDMANNDNDPSKTATSGYHGNMVAGVAAAHTNNARGIAGVAYNARFLPVKVAKTETGYISAGYEGIVYAADHNCAVINCSWGGVYIENMYAIDIIRYATFNRNALVVAAAGNNNNSSVLYPASLDYVLSVGGTAKKDEKWTPQNSTSTGGSNWNHFIDLSAPATLYPVVTSNNSYITLSGGTSCASPQVAGAAAILKSARPNLSALQIGEQLKVTADYIDTIPYNSNYKDLLGYGRLNVYKALTDSLLPSIYLLNENFVSKNKHILSGDTVVVAGMLTNYLKAYSNIRISVTADNEYLTFVSDSFLIDTIQENSSKYTDSVFIFSIASDAPDNFVVNFKLEFTANNYRSYQYITLDISQNSFDIEINKITTTVTGNGMIGITDNNTGKKIRYLDNEILFDAGLFYGNSNILYPKIVSCFRGTSDFAVLEKPQYITDSFFDLATQSVFNDKKALDRAYGFTTTQKIFSKNIINHDFIIYSNEIVNTSANKFTDLYFGIYADFEIYNPEYNEARYDASSNMIYVFSKEKKNLFAGITVLSENNFSHYAIDNVLGNTVYLNDVFSELEKQICLLNKRSLAGVNVVNGNDVAVVASAYEKEIEPNDTITFVYSIVFGTSFEKLQSTALYVKNMYDSLYNKTNTETTYLTPVDNSPNARFYLLEGENLKFENAQNYSFSIHDVLGRAYNIEVKNDMIITENLRKGYYLLQYGNKKVQNTISIIIR
ncbi:MAG: S8 family serine peptidase [Bacteroidales bacterium]|nr:S8 family serine peptidase [Bacteroidales bacterium]